MTTFANNNIDKAFAKRDKALLMPFIEAGLVSMRTTVEGVLACERAGASLIELGIPFSDPVADGPTIQLASERSLDNGTSLQGALDALSDIRKTSEIPVVVFSYYNPIYAMGDDTFVEKAKAAGADAVLIPDMPLEESYDFQAKLAAANIHLIHLISLSSSDERIEAICKNASGFLYLVAVLGVTGARSDLNPELESFVNRVRKFTDIPLAVGFGISTPTHVKAVGEFADGIIVASALADRMMKSDSEDAAIKVVEEFVAEIAP